MSWFRLTPAQDTNSCLWFNDLSVIQDRVIRVSISTYANDDARVDKNFPSWVHFKVFTPLKLINRPVIVLKIQQVALRPIEMERFFGAIEELRLVLLPAMYTKHDQLISTEKELQTRTDSKDSETCHWYRDIHESCLRKVRVSYTALEDDGATSHIDIHLKLFKRKTDKTQFRMSSDVTLGLTEISELSNLSDDLQHTIREIVYGH